MKKNTYKKWRELSINPFEIKFKELRVNEIINYPYAGNDVIECLCDYKGNIIDTFIKIERSKMADLSSERKNIEILRNNNYYLKIPKIIEYCKYNNKDIIALEKINGKRLSDILRLRKNKISLNDFLYKYGMELALIHSIPKEKFEIAKKRIINDIPNKSDYKLWDNKLNKYISYLQKNIPQNKTECFIHGDFHYANILWYYNNISGILDFEYSGIGFKEQDIAWSLILRPGQEFLNNTHHIKTFLDGYKNIGSYNSNSLKWCYINGCCHFYLMNTNNEEYKNLLINLMESIFSLNL